MTKFLHVEFNHNDYERMMRNMTAKERAEHNRCVGKNADVLARSFEAQLQDFCTKSATRSLLRGKNANSSCAGVSIEGFDKKIPSGMS